MLPSRINRASRPSGSSPNLLVTGSSRATAINNQNRRTTLQTIDESTELVFGLIVSYTDLLHKAIVAGRIRTFSFSELGNGRQSSWDVRCESRGHRPRALPL